MPTYVVTGAARGLGYAFIKLLASDPANTVIGLVRNSTTARARLAPDSITNVHVIPADITDKVAMKRAAEESREVLDGKGLDVLICNAAYISEVSALKSVQEFEQDTLTLFDDAEKSFNVNVLGTLKTVFAFLPLIQEGQLKKVVATSSGMGDIVSAGDMARYEKINKKFEKYAPGIRPSPPNVSAESCLAAINRSSLATGHGGLFFSHNGTRRWM